MPSLGGTTGRRVYIVAAARSALPGNEHSFRCPRRVVSADQVALVHCEIQVGRPVDLIALHGRRQAFVETQKRTKKWPPPPDNIDVLPPVSYTGLHCGVELLQ